MKRQILFIQGGGSGAHKEDKKMVASLRSVLGALYEVRYPTMQQESDPDYERWKEQIRKELAAVKGDLILVGHSLGGSFLLKYLSEEKTDATIAGLFLIATPFWGGDGWRYDGYEAVTLRENFTSKLPKAAPIFFYHSDDDETVPFTHLALYGEKLSQAVTREFHGRGHQLSNDLSEIAEDIKSLE